MRVTMKGNSGGGGVGDEREKGRPWARGEEVGRERGRERDREEHAVSKV